MRLQCPTSLLFGTACALSATIVLGQVPVERGGESPTVKILQVPDFWGSYTIWGATGFDAADHIFIGVTSNDARGSGSAHLFELNPANDTLFDRGNVIAELERLGIRRPNETQMKIHSRIVQASDGFVYFSSMDETGESEDGTKLPTWGGHLWRRGRSGAWEHLKATQEALIAVATGGPYVYSLGYFNHVLYQFDTRTRRIRSIVVGSAGGHVSRNFFVDDRGHAFVPRVTRTGQNTASAAVVEFDPSLAEVGSHPLDEYFEASPDDSHGIVAVASDGSHGGFFVTGKGRLYHLESQPIGASLVTDLGWFHPRGPHYVASMFRDERTGVLYGVAEQTSNGGRGFEWLARAPGGQTSVSIFPYGEAPAFPNSAVLYGSMTRDSHDRFYVVGSMHYKPVVLQVTPRR